MSDPNLRQTVLINTIRECAEQSPNQTAIQEVDGLSVTWSEVYRESLRRASAFERLGVVAGETVLTMLPNAVDSYFTWLGVAWLRAIEVPINTSHKGRMLEYMVTYSEARILVVAERYLDTLIDVAGRLSGVELVVVPDATGPLPALPIRTLDRAEFLAGVAADDDRPNPDPHDIAAMIYTSGTTGPSKGVLVPWTELFLFAEHLCGELVPPHGAYYSVYPPCHISGKSALFYAASSSARLVLRDGFSASRFWSDIREFDCTSVMLIGPMAAILMAAPAEPDDAENPLQNVSLGPLPARLDDFKRRFGVRVTTAYGSTEIGLPLVGGWDLPNSRTCGRVRTGFPGYEARIVDVNDQPLDPGQVGELVIRSREPWALCAGYFGRAKETAEAWRNGWFHTGDAFMADAEGWFYFVDRIKDTIRRRGENISSFEVEECVNQHPAVAESVAVAVPSELGEDDILVVARVRPGHPLTPDELAAFLVDTAPKFMVPRYVEFVDEFPRTETTHRIRKMELRKRGVTASTWDRSRTRAVT
jgi:carnitine-CoA ligase